LTVVWSSWEFLVICCSSNFASLSQVPSLAICGRKDPSTIPYWTSILDYSWYIYFLFKCFVKDKTKLTIKLFTRKSVFCFFSKCWSFS
jgi:hypothetical protein